MNCLKYGESRILSWIDTLSDPAASLLGAFVGVFGGLLAILIGALVNAELNRRRDDRLITVKACAIATALREELLLMKDILTDSIDVLRKDDASDTVSSVLSDNITVYPNIIKDLIFLDSHAITPVIEAYGVIDNLKFNELLVGVRVAELPNGQKQYITPNKNRSKVALLLEKAVSHVDIAIDALTIQIEKR